MITKVDQLETFMRQDVKPCSVEKKRYWNDYHHFVFRLEVRTNGNACLVNSSTPWLYFLNKKGTLKY